MLRKEASEKCLSELLEGCFHLVQSAADEIWKDYSCQQMPCGPEETAQWLEIKRHKCDLHSDLGGPGHCARLILSSKGQICFDTLGNRVVNKVCKTEDEWHTAVNTCAGKLYKSWRHCSGFTEDQLSQFAPLVNKKNRRGFILNQTPFPSHRSLKCHLWFDGEENRQKRNLEGLHTLCDACIDSARALVKENKRQSNYDKRRWTKPDSKVNISKLCAESKRNRLKSVHRKATYPPKQSGELEKDYEILLNDDQSEQLSHIVNKIDENDSIIEEFLVNEIDRTSDEFVNFCRMSWRKDCQRNKPGHCGNRWSIFTYKMALAIYSRSSSAYSVLRDSPVLNLPSVRSLQNFMSRFYNFLPGVNEEYIARQAEQFFESQNEKQQPGLAKGIMVFDEVKIIGKVIWNSKNNEIIGLATNESERLTVYDLFKDVQNESQASKAAEYALQFLFRDLTCKSDVIGPYFLLRKTCDKNVIIACLFQTMQAFHKYGFEIYGLVCDAASYNMAVIKALCGYSHSTVPLSDGPDKFRVSAHFTNPFNPNIQIAVIPCPTHGLKNYINVLHSSKTGGTRALQLNSERNTFGWHTIREMGEREHQRVQSGQPRAIPGLRQEYIERNPWTKLSVLPAKIMMQQKVLAELKAFLRTLPGRTDIADTIAYLEAGQSIFENGFLSHNVLSGAEYRHFTCH